MSTNIAIGENYYWADKVPKHLAICILSIVLVAMAVLLRLVAQALPLPNNNTLERPSLPDALRWKRGLTKYDFWFVVLAAIFALASTACNVTAFHHGLGKQLVRVLDEDPHPPRNIAYILMYGYIIKIIHVPAIMFTKLSIIFFYLRLFARPNPRLEWTLYIIATWSILLGIASTIMYIFSCTPPSFSWNQVYAPNKAVPAGRCMPLALSVTIPLICNLVSEIALLIIPAIALRNIRLSWKKRIGLYFTFTLGGFVTTISVIRIYYAWKLDDVSNFTYDQAEPVLWTSLEVCLGVVCACIPAMAPLYRIFRVKVSSTGDQYWMDRRFFRWPRITRKPDPPDGLTHEVNDSETELYLVSDRPTPPGDTIYDNKSGSTIVKQ